MEVKHHGFWEWVTIKGTVRGTGRGTGTAVTFVHVIDYGNEELIMCEKNALGITLMAA